MTLKGAFLCAEVPGPCGSVALQRLLEQCSSQGKALHHAAMSFISRHRYMVEGPFYPARRRLQQTGSVLRDPDRNRTCDVRGMLPECYPQGFSATITGSPYLVMSYKVHSKPSITPPHVAGQHSSTNVPKAVECCHSGPDGNRTRLASLAHQC